jgi:hypothetical protein
MRADVRQEATRVVAVMAPFVVGMGLRHGWPWALAMAVLGGAVGALVSSLRIELGP